MGIIGWVLNSSFGFFLYKKQKFFFVIFYISPQFVDREKWQAISQLSYETFQPVTLCQNIRGMLYTGPKRVLKLRVLLGIYGDKI